MNEQGKTWLFMASVSHLKLPKEPKASGFGYFLKKKVEGREYSLADGVFYSSVEWGEAEELNSVPGTCSPLPKSKAVRVYHGHSRPDLCLHRHLTINAS